MRCQSCNAHLSIEDEKCPYCGTPNPEAIRHRQEMKLFSGEFARTRSSVLKTTSETAAKSMRFVIICILAILTILSFVFMANSWSVVSMVSDWKANANREKYFEILDKYEKTDDYLSFVAFYDQNSLYGADAYEEYYYLYNVAYNYRNIYDYTLSLMEEEPYDGYHENALKYLCNSVSYFYEYLDSDRYDFYEEAGAYDEVHLQTIERITQKAENLIQLCFSIPEEEMKAFRDFSPAEKQVFIERRYQKNE